MLFPRGALGLYQEGTVKIVLLAEILPPTDIPRQTTESLIKSKSFFGYTVYTGI